MTRHFSKLAEKQKIPVHELSNALSEVQEVVVEANLGGNLYKKRIRFQGQGKRSSGRTIICYKNADRAIFIHGFAKNEKSNLSRKELVAFKALAEILLGLSDSEIEISVEKGALLEVKL